MHVTTQHSIAQHSTVGKASLKPYTNKQASTINRPRQHHTFPMLSYCVAVSSGGPSTVTVDAWWWWPGDDGLVMMAWWWVTTRQP